ncbi:MAG: HAD family hydrolase [Eubacteriaceae bacterium]|nr:HAD family hydrolase [Eubacteriaceae bacterium]
MFNDVSTVIFDFDGTLHNSILIYGPAFRKAYAFLVKTGKAPEREWQDEEISIWLGYNSQDMWNEFMPGLDFDLKREVSSIIGEEMLKLIDSGHAKLYEGALEVVKELKRRGIDLVFLSNCKKAYRDAVTRAFGLDEYFSCLISTEEFDFIPKYDIIRKVSSKFQKEILIVGDRIQDIEAGFMNDIRTVGCVYGFGKAEEFKLADALIKDIRDLPDLL